MYIQLNYKQIQLHMITKVFGIFSKFKSSELSKFKKKSRQSSKKTPSKVQENYRREIAPYFYDNNFSYKRYACPAQAGISPTSEFQQKKKD